MSVYFDVINAGFELFGAVAAWANVVRIRRDRYVSGVSIPSMAFFASWGVWNLVYYPHLGQWLSAGAGLLLVIANITWLLLYIRYERNGERI